MTKQLEELKKNTRGVVIAMNTPFKDDYSLDLDGFRRNVEHTIDAGVVKGTGVLLVCGGGGEISFLKPEEIEQYVRVAAEVSNGRAHVMAGVYSESVMHAREDARRMQDAGADSLQMGPPRWPGLTMDDFYRYYEGVAGAIDIGISVYNTHWYTRLMSADDILRLAEIDNVIAVKWSHPNYQAFLSGVQTLAGHIIIFDNQVAAVPSHSLGASGYISTTGPWWPAYEVKIVKALQAGDFTGAEKLLLDLVYPFRKFWGELSARTQKGGPSAILKAAAELCGMVGGVSRPPSADLNRAEIAEMREFLVAHGVPVV